MRTHDPEKTLRQQMVILKVFSELSKAIQLHSQNYNMEDAEENINMEIKLTENIENFFGQVVFDKDIFDVINF